MPKSELKQVRGDFGAPPSLAAGCPTHLTEAYLFGPTAANSLKSFP